MSKTKAEIIEWLLEFSQMEFTNLTAGDKAKLAIDVKEYLFLDDEIEQATGNLENFSPDLNEDINELKKAILTQKEELKKTKDGNMRVFLRENIEYLESTYKKYPLSGVKQVLEKENQKEYWELLSIVQSLIYAFWEYILIISNDPAHIVKEHDDNLLNNGDITNSVFFVIDGEFNYLRIPITTHLYEYFATKLYSLVSGLKVAAIRRCLECGRIFFNPSLREKKFCSSRCQSRFHAAKRREAKRDKTKEVNP